MSIISQNAINWLKYMNILTISIVHLKGKKMFYIISFISDCVSEAGKLLSIIVTTTILFLLWRIFEATPDTSVYSISQELKSEATQLAILMLSVFAWTIRVVMIGVFGSPKTPAGYIVSTSVARYGQSSPAVYNVPKTGKSDNT